MGIIETLALIAASYVQLKNMKRTDNYGKREYSLLYAVLIVLVVVGLLKLFYLFGFEFGGFIYQLIN